MAKTKTEHIKSASRTHSNYSKTKSQAQIKTETVASFFQGKKKNLEHTPYEFYNSSPMIIGLPVLPLPPGANP